MYQTLLSNLKTACHYLNQKLIQPADIVHDKLSLGTESLPLVLKTPLAFSGLLAFVFFLIFNFANNLICNLIGIVYPIYYLLPRLKENNPKLLTINKYWILFGILQFVESFIGFILYYIPGYFYLKFGLLYMLVRNDFAMTNVVYTFAGERYYRSSLRPVVQEVVRKVEGVLQEKIY